MKKNISLIRSASLASVDYAYASRVPEGMDLLFLAGACPLTNDGTVLDPGNYASQAKRCVDNIKVILEENAATLENIVYTRVLVASTERADLVTAWESIRKEFGNHDVPSTLTGVTVLGYPNQLVEIEAIAAVEKK